MPETEGELSISEDAVPLVCEGKDFKRLTLSSPEGYLLSRLDGTITVGLLCQASGLGQEQTMELLSSLYAQGIIIFKDPAASPPAKPAPATPVSPVAATPPVTLDLKSLKKILAQPLPKGEALIPVVEAIFGNLEHLSYYELLGVSWRAEEREIKKAYLRRTKSFHPDRFYRRADREFKIKLQEIFKQVNKAQRILLDPEDRKAYDASLGEEETTEETAEAPAAAAGRTRMVKGEAHTHFKRIRIPPKPIEERMKARPAETARLVSQGPKLKLNLREKRPSGLMKKIGEIKSQEVKIRNQQVEKFMKGAELEKGRGNFKGALVNLQLALQYDPHNPKIKEAIANLSREEELKKAEDAFRAGKAAQQGKDLDAALQYYKEALRLRYESPELYASLAEVLVLKRDNLEWAKKFILKAMELSEHVPAYHMILGRIFLGLGHKAAALQQFETVLKLDPKNKEAGKELKILRRK